MEEGYEPFHLDNDYEGGQWIGGEFFYESERRRPQMSKEDSLYGVFNETADTPNLKATKAQRFQKANASDLDDGDNDGPVRAGLGSHKRSVRANQGKTTQQPEFEKFTKGIGSKLLQKMGWKGGGLQSSTGEGIAAPIQVKLRPKNRGLGCDWEEQHLVPMDMDENKTEQTESATSPAEERTPSWKKPRGPVKVKKVFKTTQEVLAETKHQKQVILDLTQQQPRILTSLSQREEGATTATLPAPELQHNLSFLTDMKEIRMQELHRKIRQEEDSISRLSAETIRLQARIAAQEEEATLIRSLQQICHSFRTAPRSFGRSSKSKKEDMVEMYEPVKPTEHKEGEGIQSLISTIQSLKQRHDAVWSIHNVPALVAGITAPLLKASLKSWLPLDNPLEPIPLIQPWRSILSSNTENDALYELLLEETVLPPIRRAITGSWNVREPNACVILIEGWEDVLVPRMWAQLLLQVVLPKLSGEVEKWNPRTDIVPIHQWLHPWLPLLGKHMESLYPGIAHKLQQALNHWHPADSSAHAMLLPWRQVFPAQQLLSLITSAILPKLRTALQSELVVIPSQQFLAPFEWVIRWQDLLPTDQLASLLQSYFFPAWLQVLSAWLSGGPNFDELAAWYLGWKKLFPVAVQRDIRVRAQLNYALELMSWHANQCISGGCDRTTKPVPPLVSSAFSQPEPSTSSLFYRTTEPNNASLPLEKEPSMKEVLTRFAQENNVPFLPKKRKHDGAALTTPQGKSIYSFGLVPVIIDNELVCIQSSTAPTSWTPVSFTTLLDMALGKKM